MVASYPASQRQQHRAAGGSDNDRKHRVSEAGRGEKRARRQNQEPDSKGGPEDEIVQTSQQPVLVRNWLDSPLGRFEQCQVLSRALALISIANANA